MMIQLERSIETKEAIGRAHVKDLLTSILVGEALNPGEIYILSPWISDFPVLELTDRESTIRGRSTKPTFSS